MENKLNIHFFLCKVAYGTDNLGSLLLNYHLKEALDMEVISLSQHTFEEQINHGVTLVDFYADWCGPCKMQMPIVEEVADEMKGRAAVAKLNVDDESKLAETYGVMSIPTLLLFKDGVLAGRWVGLQSKSFLQENIEEVIAQ